MSQALHAHHGILNAAALQHAILAAAKPFDQDVDLKVAMAMLWSHAASVAQGYARVEGDFMTSRDALGAHKERGTVFRRHVARILCPSKLSELDVDAS